MLICDHASNDVPEGVDLGIPAALLDKHIAIDIGAAPVLLNANGDAGLQGLGLRDPGNICRYGIQAVPTHPSQ